MNEIFASVLDFIVISSKIDLQNLKPLLGINWLSPAAQEDYFYDAKTFVKRLITNYPTSLKNLSRLTESQQEDFYQTFKGFLAKMLDLIIEYLPYDTKVIDTFDFAEKTSNFSELDEKVIVFNNFFKLIKEEDIPQLRTEIMKVCSKKSFQNSEVSKHILHYWDRIEVDKQDDTSIILLPKLVKAAHALPTSSSDVEQCFSGMKLVKTLLRNRLSEERLEAILLIIQEYKDKKALVITSEMLNLFKNAKEKLNLRKSSSTNQVMMNKNDIDNQEEEYFIWDEDLEKEIVMKSKKVKKNSEKRL